MEDLFLDSSHPLNSSAYVAAEQIAQFMEISEALLGVWLNVDSRNVPLADKTIQFRS